MRLETLAVRAGNAPDPATGAVTPPIHLSTTFEREADGSYRSGFLYSRNANPNRNALELAMTVLEGGAVAAAFASGSAATMTLIQALGPNAHIIAPEDAYYGTIKLMQEIFGPWGIVTTPLDMTDLDAIEAALRPATRLIWVETPSNPLLRVVDIARITELARRAGALTVVDNTWGTPVLQRPLDLGADIAMHSTTKYLGGHCDVLGGVLVSREETGLFQRIRDIQGTGGAVPSPFECWLTLRGIRTLPCRMHAHSSNALTLAHFLLAHPAVEAVHYPGLSSHAGHAIAAKQMSAFGGMLSVQVGRTADEARAIAARLRIFTQATSLGGTESLVEHRASVEGPATRAPANLLRVSVGLESTDDMIEDWEQALR